MLVWCKRRHGNQGLPEVNFRLSGGSAQDNQVKPEVNCCFRLQNPLGYLADRQTRHRSIHLLCVCFVVLRVHWLACGGDFVPPRTITMKDHEHRDPLAQLITQHFSVVWMRCLLAVCVHWLGVCAVSWTYGPEAALCLGLLGAWLLVATAVWFHISTWRAVIHRCASSPYRITQLLIIRHTIATEFVLWTAVFAEGATFVTLPASVEPTWNALLYPQGVVYVGLLLARAYSTVILARMARDRAARTKREQCIVSSQQPPF